MHCVPWSSRCSKSARSLEALSSPRVQRMSERIPADLARRVRLVLLDVDGVLTDGGVYVGATQQGESVELKRFEITDQLGIKMLVWSGIQVALVSGRESSASRIRAEELGVECLQQDGGHKIANVRSLMV